jgi:hypothetical protein
MVLLSGCAQGRAAGEKQGSDIKLGPEVIQGAVTFEPGTKDGAIVPEISSPRLRAIMVEEKIEGNRLVERHREWILDGEAQLLGIPHELKGAKETKKITKPPVKQGGEDEN